MTSDPVDVRSRYGSESLSRNGFGFLPVPVRVVPALSMYDHLSGGVFPFLGRVDVGDEHVLQAQVEALVLGVVREEEKGPEAQRDEGTEDEEEDELLREPQRGSVVGERGGAGGQGGNPSARQGQQRRRRHGRKRLGSNLSLGGWGWGVPRGQGGGVGGGGEFTNATCVVAAQSPSGFIISSPRPSVPEPKILSGGAAGRQQNARHASGKGTEQEPFIQSPFLPPSSRVTPPPLPHPLGLKPKRTWCVFS